MVAETDPQTETMPKAFLLAHSVCEITMIHTLSSAYALLIRQTETVLEAKPLLLSQIALKKIYL